MMVDESSYVVLSDLEEGEIPDYEVEEKLQNVALKPESNDITNIEKTLYNKQELRNALSTYYSITQSTYGKPTANFIPHRTAMRKCSSDRHIKRVKSKISSTKKWRTEYVEDGKINNKHGCYIENRNKKKSRLRKPGVDSCIDFFHKQRMKALSKSLASHSTNENLSYSIVTDKDYKAVQNSHDASIENQQVATFKKVCDQNDGTIKSKDVTSPVSAVPGSLGEMLLKMQQKGKPKAEPPKIINSISDKANINSINEIKSDLQNEQKMSIKDDEEDELKLRYIALQSAVHSHNKKKKNGTNDAVATSCIKEKKKDFNSGEPECLEITQLLESNSQMKNFVKLSSVLSHTCKDEKLDNYILNRQYLQNNSVENSAIDMEISNDSSNEVSEFFQKNKQANLNGTSFSTVLSEINQTSNVNEFEKFPSVMQSSDGKSISKKQTEPLLELANNNETAQSFPVEWAYMLPPPPQPDQPENDLNSFNNWSYNQNMCVQVQNMLSSIHTDQHNINSVVTQPLSDVENLCYSINNVDSSKLDVKPADVVHQPVCDLQDSYATQYQSFMSSVLHHQNNKVFKSEIDDQQIVNKKQNKNLNSAIRTLTVVPIDKGIKDVSSIPKIIPKSGKKRARRRRKSNKGTSVINESDNKSENFSLSKHKEDKLNTCDNDDALNNSEDEDILRAQLLKSMSISKPNIGKEQQKLGTGTASRLIPKKQKMSSLNDSFAKKLGYSNSVSSKRNTISQSIAKLQVKGHDVLKKKIEMSKRINAFTLDIGGKYLGTKSPFSEPSLHNRNDLPLFKFPVIKPVIITLTNDSDTSDEEPRPVTKDLSIFNSSNTKPETVDVASCIDNLLKSYRNCNDTDQSILPQVGRNAPTTKCIANVSLLSETKQEEYKKLRQLLNKKKKQLQVREDSDSAHVLNSMKDHSSNRLFTKLNKVRRNANEIRETKKISNILKMSPSPSLEDVHKVVCSEKLGDIDIIVPQLDSCNISEAILKNNYLLEDNSSKVISDQDILSNIEKSPVSDKQAFMIDQATLPLVSHDLYINQRMQPNDQLDKSDNIDILNNQHKESNNNEISIVSPIISDDLDCKPKKCKQAIEENFKNSFLISGSISCDLGNSTSSDSSDEDSSSSSSSNSSSSESSDEEGAICDNHKLNEISLREKLLIKRRNLLDQKICSNDKNEVDFNIFKEINTSVNILHCDNPTLDMKVSKQNAVGDIEACLQSISTDTVYIKDNLANNSGVMDSCELLTEEAIESHDKNIPKETNNFCSELEAANIFELDTVGNLDFLKSASIEFIEKDKENINNEKALYNPRSESCKLPANISSYKQDSTTADCYGNDSKETKKPVSHVSSNLKIKNIRNSPTKLMIPNKQMQPNIILNLNKEGIPLGTDKNIYRPPVNVNSKKLLKNNYNSGSSSLLGSFAKESNSNNDEKQKLLKRIREEYAKMYVSRNGLSLQISKLVKEANDDVTSRQTILRQISKLYLQLEKLHSVEKKKASSIQERIDTLLKLQQALDEDNKRLEELQRLSKQVVSSKSSCSEDCVNILEKQDLERKQLIMKIRFLEQSLRSKADASGNIPSNYRKKITDPLMCNFNQAENKLHKTENLPSTSECNLLSDIAPPKDSLKPKVDLEMESLDKVTANTKLINSRSNLDILCPYDLLGKCNDDQCSFKHTSSNCDLVSFCESSILEKEGDNACGKTVKLDQLSEEPLSEYLEKCPPETSLNCNKTNSYSSTSQQPLLVCESQNSSENFNDEENVFVIQDSESSLSIQKESNIHCQRPEFIESSFESSVLQLFIRKFGDHKIGNEIVVLERLIPSALVPLNIFKTKNSVDLDKSNISSVAQKRLKTADKRAEQDIYNQENNQACITNSVFLHTNNDNEKIGFEKECNDSKLAQLLVKDNCTENFIHRDSSYSSSVDFYEDLELKNVTPIISKIVNVDNNTSSTICAQNKRRRTVELDPPSYKHFYKIQGDKNIYNDEQKLVTSNASTSEKNLQPCSLPCTLPNSNLQKIRTRHSSSKSQGVIQLQQKVPYQPRTRQSARLRKKK